MEFTPVSTHRAGGFFDYASMRRHPARPQGGRVAGLPAGFYFMFWCFVAVLCGTLKLTMGATTTVTDSISSLQLFVSEDSLLSDEALLEWTLTTINPSPQQVTNYHITYQIEGRNSKTIITVDSSFTSETLRNLEADMPYRAFVKVVFNSTEVPSLTSNMVQFTTPKQAYRHAPMGPKEFVILFTIFALWGLAMLRFFCTWNKKMNLRVTKDSIRARDASPTHRHLEAYKSNLHKKAKAKSSRNLHSAQQQPLMASTSRGASFKSFKTRAANLSRKGRYMYSKASQSSTPTRASSSLEYHDDARPTTSMPTEPPPRSPTQSRTQSHSATALAAASAIAVPVHVSYDLAGGGSTTTSSSSPPTSPQPSRQSVI